MHFFKKIWNFLRKPLYEIKIIDLKKGEIFNLKDLKTVNLRGNILDENKRKIVKAGLSNLLSLSEGWMNLIEKNGIYVNNYLIQLENGKRIIIIGDFE